MGRRRLGWRIKVRKEEKDWKKGERLGSRRKMGKKEPCWEGERLGRRKKV